MLFVWVVFAWLIIQDPAAKIPCSGQCGGACKSPPLLGRGADSWVLPCTGLVLMLPFCPSVCIHMWVCAPPQKRGLEESSPWEYPWLVSLSPEGLPSLPVAQSLLPPPLFLLCYQERHTFGQDSETLACE